MLVVLPSILLSQNIDEIQLGIVKGEMKEFYGRLNWVNTSNQEVSGEFWTDKEWLKLPSSSFSIINGDTLTFNYTINISDAIGLQQAEVRLVDTEGILLQGFLLKGRFLPADTLALETYRNEYFPFKAKEQVFNLGAGFNTEQFSRSFTLYNFGGDSLDLSAISTKNKGLKFRFSPTKIAHNQFTRMELTYSPDSMLTRGFVRENLSLWDANKKLIAVMPVQYTLEDDLTSESGLAPKLLVSKESHDFKVMSSGLMKQVSIKISNIGDVDLSFFKIESNCDCLTYSLKTDVLSPGQSTELIVQFNADQRIGYERKTLAIFSNDPAESTKVLVFKAHVK